jgi:uncharacterized protein (TIGR03435 family)
MHHSARTSGILALAAFTFAPSLFAQAQTTAAGPAPAPDFKYDVASIKLTPPGSADVSARVTADGFIATNVTLRGLITDAYGIQNIQVVGAPDWFTSERYDIDAKMDPDIAEAFRKLAPPARKLARQQMLQALLAERFALTIHRETRELPGYSLAIAKNGPKLQETKTDPGNPTAAQQAAAGGGPSVRDSRNGTGPETLTVLHCSAASLTAILSQVARRPVIDNTGLASMYDFVLRFQPDDLSAAAAPGAGSSTPLVADPAPSFLTAVQEQLGLKLESGKYLIPVLVIDHVEHPSAN